MINGMTCSNVTMKCASELSDLIRASFQTILNQIVDFSPSDSTVTAELDIKEGIYNADVEIHSQELTITTKRSDNSIVSLLSAIKHDLMDQIDAWRKVRTVESA